jgi:cell division transport system ATP-binding protein
MSASERHIRARHLPAARGRQQRQPVAPQSRVPQTPPDARNVIEFRNVCMHYPAGDIGLDGATFNVRRGEFLFIVGSTGSGKSTIMRLLIKEREPTSGTIRVAGRDLGSLEHNKVPYYRRNIGVVFQDFKLLPNRTVYDNVAYALSATGARRKEIRTKVPDVLRLTGLSTKLHNYPDQLSGGEQQRVAVARAFVNHPPLLLADEPTGNLDPNTSLGIMQLLYRIYRAGTTVIVATHDAHMVDRMRRRVIELSGGQIIRDEASGMYAQGDQTTAEFGDMLDRAYGQLGRDQPTGDFRPIGEQDTGSHQLWTPDGPPRHPDPPSPGGGGFRNY